MLTAWSPACGTVGMWWNLRSYAQKDVEGVPLTRCWGPGPLLSLLLGHLEMNRVLPPCTVPQCTLPSQDPSNGALGPWTGTSETVSQNKSLRAVSWNVRNNDQVFCHSNGKLTNIFPLRIFLPAPACIRLAAFFFQDSLCSFMPENTFL